MRRFFLVAALAGLAPVSLAFAQSPASPAPAMAAPSPENCGTPDEPKTCPPMPRHALKHFHVKKKATG